MNYYFILGISIMSLPYFLLIYKKLSLSIRLMFISMIQLSIFSVIGIIALLTNENLLFSSLLFLFGMMSTFTVIINIALIIIIWIIKKFHYILLRYNKKGN